MSLLVNWLESLHSDLEVTDRCSRWKNYKSTCSICLEKCTEKAFYGEDTRILIKPEQCTMCGECVVACPLSAIDGTGPERIFQDLALVYEESYTPSLKELLIYKKRGIDTILVKHKNLNEQWLKLLDEVNNVLENLDETPYEIIEQHQDKSLSRRAFFTSLQKEGKHLLANMAPAAWRKGSWSLSYYYPEHQFFSVKIDTEKCTLCGACRNVCLHQVFSFDGSTFKIDHQKCTDCTSCRDVCPEVAIKVVNNIQKAEITEHNLFEEECQSCKHLYLTFQKESDHCNICEKRDIEWLSPYM